jgi:hypothetical protein
MVTQLAFMLALVMLAAAGVVFAASELRGHGVHWADQVCTGAAAALCADPAAVGAVTAAIVAAYFILRELEV